MNKNSALIWYPPLVAAALPVPKTEFVEFDPDDLYPTLDGEPMRPGFPMASITEAASRIGYPVFVRTDLASAKHVGPDAYRAESEGDLLRCVCLTFEDNALKDIESDVSAFMIREWLDLPGAFTCFHGHPIAREWRLFASSDEVKCEHFYWPEGAIDSWSWSKELPDDWKLRLKDLSVAPGPDTAVKLRELAMYAASRVGGGIWSVDFTEDVNKTWWVTDMATAEDSWHPEHEF